MNLYIKALLSLAVIAPCISVQAQNNKAETCLQLLGAGIYNQSLEEACAFNGGVKDKLKSLYSNSGCRNVISQEDVKKVARDVLVDFKARYELLGKANFCAGNKKAYLDLANTADIPLKSKAGESF